jgi:hypothetical protein
VGSGRCVHDPGAGGQDEVRASTVLVVVLAILGSPFVMLGLWLRRDVPTVGELR